ncbi:MAG: hypothetical protein H7X95_06570 [Deltaproteobacteria bacterium]|nr:hypothetical protein [Deltaproteobacteria bacterium]
MLVPVRFGFHEFIVSAMFSLVVFAAAPSCSLLLNEDAKQCEEDRDCARFPNAVCNRNAGICIARPTFMTSTGGAAGTTGFQPADAGQFGSSGGGGPGSTGGNSGRNGFSGASGAQDAGVAATGGRHECPDLDRNGVLDCKESLVINSDFRTGVEGWTPELDMRQGFASSGSDGLPASGAIAVINASQSDTALGSTMGGAKQCLPATGPTTYDIFLQTLVAPNPDGLTSSGAAFQFFPLADCSGVPSGTFMLPLADVNLTGWRVLQGRMAIPAGTRSLLVRLVVLKPFKQAATQALFDNVLVKVH